VLIHIQRNAGAIELSVHPPLAIRRSHDEATARASAQSHGQNLDEERDSGSSRSAFG